MIDPIPASTPDQAVLLARYKENADQARQHETLRERTTAMVAQTTGILLGLVGFKEGSVHQNQLVPFVSAFVILLGLWGVFSSLLFERRLRRHRKRIDSIRAHLEPSFGPEEKSHWTIWIWVLFHCGIVALGVTLWCWWHTSPSS
jgi:hypothetical protein